MIYLAGFVLVVRFVLFLLAAILGVSSVVWFHDARRRILNDRERSDRQFVAAMLILWSIACLLFSQATR